MSDLTENAVPNTDVNGESNDKGTKTGGSEANTNTNNSPATKSMTQEQIDALIKSAKADAKASAKREFEKNYEGKIVLTEDELSEKINNAVTSYKAEQALVTIKKSIQNEYGLNDAQVSRLSGDTEDALKADAELLFGTLKKKEAPKLQTGSNSVDTNDNEPNAELKRRLQANLDRIKR